MTLLNELLSYWANYPVYQASIILFPPLGEPNVNNWDISIALSFAEGAKKFYITTENCWNCTVKETFCQFPLPQFDFEQDFKYRTENWSLNPNFEQNEILTFEEYDLKNSNIFKFLYENKCTSASFICLANHQEEPFGLHFVLENGFYLTSCLGADGNFIKTQFFNPQFNFLDFVGFMGEVIFLPIKM